MELNFPWSTWERRGSAEIRAGGPRPSALLLSYACKSEGAAWHELPQALHGDVWRVEIDWRSAGDFSCVAVFMKAMASTKSGEPIRAFILGDKQGSFLTPVAPPLQPPYTANLNAGRFVHDMPILLAEGETARVEIITQGGYGCAGFMAVDQVTLRRIGTVPCVRPNRQTARTHRDQPALHMNDVIVPSDRRSCPLGSGCP